MTKVEDIKRAFTNAFGDDFWGSFFGAGGFDTSVNGKRAVKYGRTWILLARVKGGLCLACEAGTKPPTPVMLIRLATFEIKDP